MNDVERTVHFLKAGLESLDLTSDVEVDPDSDSETWINLPQVGISLYVDTEGYEKRTISGTVKCTLWTVYSVHDSGGAREPEDVDLVNQGYRYTVGEAVAKVFTLVTRDRILNMIEALGLKEDLDEGQREFDAWQKQSR